MSVEARKAAAMKIDTQRRRAIPAPSGTLALTMRQPDAISQFPWVIRAFIGQPGIRLDLELKPLGIRLKERLVLAWRKPYRRASSDFYPFDLEGGDWVYGAGTVSLKPRDRGITEVTLRWDLEIPWYFGLLPGFTWSLKRGLRHATDEWLTAISGRVAAVSCAMTLADVGA